MKCIILVLQRNIFFSLHIEHKYYSAQMSNWISGADFVMFENFPSSSRNFVLSKSFLYSLWRTNSWRIL